MTKPIILLDMDAVLFDFHNGLRDLVIEDAYINGYETQIPGEFETWSLFTEHEETDREQIARIQFEIDNVHQIHGDTCLCGFTSSRSRSRTEHLTALFAEAVLSSLEGGRNV